MLLTALVGALFAGPAWGLAEQFGLQAVGQAKFKVMWFEVFEARLFTPSGKFESYQSELALELEYRRDFTRKQLLKETAKQLKPYASEAQIRLWLERLDSIFSGVKRGDRLGVYLRPSGEASFYFNRRFVGRVLDPNFGPAFVRIWLADNGAYPKLAQALKYQL